MELELVRTYYPEGTNGELTYRGKGVCFTIELSNLDNAPRKSCIPEGRYELAKRYSTNFGWHILVKNVENRSLILIHPANDANKELKGCIAPVTILEGEGLGLQSRLAFVKLKAMVYEARERNEQVFLTIKAR
ncbi:DUF5675 family protein [Ferruginibacter sp. HRS2-29]|uniref:DUF5675 family protein n=1 Tax=Ferruginibacter sp. HRS2-29 TaxID=2487334 RepID=UPI0020CD5A2D|nr:DUF5675 family protein [Ferruginibacter sp. HRS2-29]MCP9752433.1 hypothetical protein [Ferruginibacter sp. HRS2-29]